MIRKKFGPAFKGLYDGICHKSIRIQFLLGALTVIAGLILRLSSGEWVAVILAIGLVIQAEFMNTAIEYLCNYLTERRDEQIKVIKDLAAGGVLAASIAALAVAIVILLRHITGV